MDLSSKTVKKEKPLVIAIVDDEETVHDHFQQMLETYIPWNRAPFSACAPQLEHFYNCEDFEQKVQRSPNHFNFVLLDVNFPEGVNRGVECYQTCSRLFIQNNTSTVLVTAVERTMGDQLLGAAGGLSTQDLARQTGMLGFVSKALTPETQANFILGYVRTHIFQNVVIPQGPQVDKATWKDFEVIRTYSSDSIEEDSFEISYQGQNMNLSHQTSKLLYYIILFLYIVDNHRFLSAEADYMQIFSTYASPLQRSETGDVVIPYKYLVDFMKWAGMSNVYTSRSTCNRILKKIGYQLSNASKIGYFLEKQEEVKIA